MKRVDAIRAAMFRAGVSARVRRIGGDPALGDIDARFQRIWQKVTRNPWLRLACPSVHGIIRHPFHDYAYTEIVDQVHARFGDRLAAPLTWNDPTLMARIARAPEASVIVSRHYGFAYTLRALVHTGREFAAVAGFPQLIEEHYRRSGIETMPKVELIPTDNKCLVRLLGAARKGKIITCQPDAIDAATGALDFINLYFFDFAARARIPMYFAKHGMTAAGELKGYIAGPIDSRDAAVAARLFIEFSRPEASFRIHPVHGPMAVDR